jgi:hypothetical protein
LKNGVVWGDTISGDDVRRPHPRPQILAFRFVKSSEWILVAALAGHGIFDAVHGYVLENAGVPMSWPAFCLAYDLGAAGSLAWLLRRRPRDVKTRA